MKSRSLVNTCFILLIIGALALMAGCPFFMQPGSQAGVSTGSITGKVLAKGGTDNGGITVTAERTDGIASASVQRMLSGAHCKQGNRRPATTDASGTYTLSGLPPGTTPWTQAARRQKGAWPPSDSIRRLHGGSIAMG
jgi:hypothetical protein